MIQAPDFALPDQDGITHSLKDYTGKWLVLYFYPEDDTPGCTTEACEFRDGHSSLASSGTEVVGISKDSVHSHRQFADKYHLNFTLLSDESTAVLKAYGAWGPKKYMGREYIGTTRKTFLITPGGQIAKEYAKVTPLGHFGQVADEIAKIRGLEV
jgi:thioredoxin-dependent peroxiredoxin